MAVEPCMGWIPIKKKRKKKLFFIKAKHTGPNGKPRATPSICLYKILLKMKCDSLVAKDSNSLNSDSVKPSILSFWSCID